MEAALGWVCEFWPETTDRLPASKVVDAGEGEVLDIPVIDHHPLPPFPIRRLLSSLTMDADCIREEEGVFASRLCIDVWRERARCRLSGVTSGMYLQRQQVFHFAKGLGGNAMVRYSTTQRVKEYCR